MLPSRDQTNREAMANSDRIRLASDSQANNDASYEDYMRRYRARYPNSNWEPKTRRMVGPMYNPTPWLSPTSPVSCSYSRRLGC
ncbi:hypothetical protein BFJ63_vAg12544 [Fusarium oxysporum f. sp. narcissi]|uniref:Uncharacterized protein n=3 Tax=Fusarium oxysporum TaxID=5507 RepID=A0A420R3S4_FUSOX|nr:hypothetical protein BFJ65_g17243 [Fusarium oxysporum f. sp. cepae]RKL11671.1 hypothetical protein BFJ71_g154 [Fusarium oxysporum]RYC84614.1 hypothetical protein BFJ63_vAg12544 [Fusarium oxysporum f. sp. narcissi]RKK21295.1 hypothetical protein BFJ66_g17643 [Fusarium oxysporum f. sp. cepae]RKK40143.1 hypothetical protein BFJ67_g11113 [Fusarium oxysporum f. sp. cepae]